MNTGTSGVVRSGLRQKTVVGPKGECDDAHVLGQARYVGFLPSTDLARSRVFFEALGLPCVEATPYACVHDANGTLIRVTVVSELNPQPFTVGGWEVRDIDTALHALSDAGVTTKRYDGMDQDDRGVWTAPSGAQVAWFSDPDGNTLSVSQM